MTTLDIVGLILAAVLTGAMTFFSALVAPLTFTILDGNTAGRFVRGMFPWYYLVIMVLAALSAIPLFANRPTDGAIMGAVAVGAVLCRQVLMPAINRYRDRSLAGDEAAGKRFDLLHKVTVWINVVQLVLLIVVLVRFAVI